MPLVEPIKRIVIGAEEVRHPALPSNGAVEHPTKCATIDRTGMDAEANDPARVLIHDHQDPVGPQHGRFAPEQIHAPEAVSHVTQERQPGGTALRVSHRCSLTKTRVRGRCACKGHRAGFRLYWTPQVAEVQGWSASGVGRGVLRFHASDYRFCRLPGFALKYCA